jgi:hypothetical protein
MLGHINYALVVLFDHINTIIHAIHQISFSVLLAQIIQPATYTLAFAFLTYPYLYQDYR